MLRTRQEDLLETRLEGLRRSLTTTDRVLSGRDVYLNFSRDTDADSPAYSVGDRITIELEKIPNLGSSSALVEILGLNYHELAHVRYGVRRSRLIDSVAPSKRHARFLEAYMVLEEARVETLLAAKYAKLKKYFAYPVVKYFVKEQAAWPTAFLYTYGRRYLPLKIRSTFRSVFEKTYGGTGEFAEIIDKYRVLAFSSGSRVMTGAVMINDFAKLLEKYRVRALETHNSTGDDESYEKTDSYNGARHTGTSKNASDEETTDDSKEAQEQTKEQDDKESRGEDGSGFNDQEEEEGEDGEPEEGEGADGSGDGGSVQDGDDEPQGPGGGQDSEEGDDEPGDGSGAGDTSNADGDQVPGSEDGEAGNEEISAGGTDAGPSGVEAAGSSAASSPDVRSRHEPTRAELNRQRQELAEDLSEALETVLDDQDIQKDVENLRSAMEDEAGLSSTLDRHENSGEEDLKPVTAQMLAQADWLKDILRQIWAQMEPGWLYGESEGMRIDMSRASLAQSADDYESIYVDWREGQQENSGLEVVIVADESWSTCEAVPGQPGEKRTQKATVISRQIWELMYALQEVEAHVTVLSFESESRTMYDRDDRVTTKGYVHLWPRGSTDPTYALIEAKRIFSVSEMPNKLLIVTSDGQWDRNAVRNCPEILDQITGVTKVAAVIDTDGENYTFDLAHKFDVVRRTNGPIFDVMADAVTRIVEGNMSI